MNIEGKPIKLSDVSKKLNQEIDTIVDFLLSNGIIIESNPDTDISIGIYLILIKAFGTINRFNQLLERLYCQDCGEIIHPVQTSHFGAHNVLRFHCLNESCPNNEEIYLNHCLKGKCTAIIDTRISKTCNNGLLI